MKSKQPKPYNITDGVTYSILSDFTACRVRCRNRLMGITPERMRDALDVGHMMHEILALYYTEGEDAARLKFTKRYLGKQHLMSENDITNVYKVMSLYEAYVKYYGKKDDKLDWLWAEKQFDVPFSVYRLRGMRDRAYRNKQQKTWLVETKTSSTLMEDALMMELTYDLQNLLYLLATKIETGHHVSGVLYDVIVKPSYRLGKNEDVVHFRERVSDAILTEPNKYFHRYEIVYPQSEQVKFAMDLELLLQEFSRWWLGQSPTYRGQRTCRSRWNCEYIRLCATGSMEGYQLDPKAPFGELEV